MFKTAETILNTKHFFKQLYPWKSKYELATHLCNNIIHSEDGVIAINKPFGVGVQKLKNKKKKTDLFYPGCQYTLEDVVPLMQEELKSSYFVCVKSAEKFTSGVTLFAKNERAVTKLQNKLRLAKPRHIQNSCYYLVTCYPPFKGFKGETHAERVALTLDSNPYHGVAQPVVVREFSRNEMKRRDVVVIRVEYQVQDVSRDKTALIELKTDETRWNFLRVYCADMLMPILGDHLFGARVTTIKGIPTRLNPLHMRPGSDFQKLPPKMLEVLALDREDNTSTVPLHAHLRSITVPDFYGKDSPLIITAPFPDFFRWTCNSLGLNIPIE